MKKYDYDVIVIGAGSGGLTVSIGLAAAGKKVAMIEKGLIGGDCTNTGCVPSKAFIDIAKKNIERSQGRDIKDILSEVRARRQIIVDEETPEKIEKYGMKVLQGYGKIIGKNEVQIDGKQKITAKNIVISTGSHTKKYPITGVGEEDILNNENIFELKENISDLVVVGGGYIGCELAEAFANSGVNVSIIQRNIRLIPNEEPESSELIQKNLEEKGIKVFTNTIIEKSEDKILILKDKKTNNITKLKFDKILQALGREANTHKLGLKDNNIEFSQRGIKVDKYNRTNIKNIFAIGDCVEGNPMFTHGANNEGRGVIRNIIFPLIKSSNRKAVLPATLYTNIEVSRVGKTAEELFKYYEKEDIVTKKINFEDNDRSVLTQDTKGFIIVHFKRVSGKILGATIVGSHAGDMLPILTSAMQNKISAYKLASLIYSYPTKAEIIKKVADSFVVGTLSNIKAEIKYFFKDNILQIITGIIWLSIIYAYFHYKSVNNLSNLDVAKAIYTFVSTSFWGPVIYIVLYAIRPIIFFPATFMTFMSGALFGIWGGFIYTMIGENLSANFAYLLGRIFGKKLVKSESTGLIVDLKEKVSENAFISILMTRLLFFPFDAVNYISGILRVKWKGYFLGTLIGIIPGALIVIIAGASVENAQEFDLSKISFNTNMLLMAAGLFIASLIFAKFLKKKGF